MVKENVFSVCFFGAVVAAIAAMAGYNTILSIYARDVAVACVTAGKEFHASTWDCTLPRNKTTTTVETIGETTRP